MTTTSAVIEMPASRQGSTWSQVLRYVLLRLSVIALALIVGIFISVLIANLGGYIDDIMRDRIESAIMGMARSGQLRNTPSEERQQLLEQTRNEMIDAAGLNDSFLLRCLRWTFSSLTFQWSNPLLGTALPNTLILFSVASLLIFFSGLSLSLLVSHRYGGLLDKLVVTLSPLSSIPSWVHGVLLVIVFAAGLRWFPLTLNIAPYTTIIASFTESFKPRLILLRLWHMTLPVAAIFLSVIFQIVYSWRTFFLIYSDEDYVDVARAKGLPRGFIEKRYILRPTLPYIITNFALVLISFWQTSMVLEYFFKWPGIGNLYITSVQHSTYNPSVVMGVVTLFAYLLAITVFVLDLVYALVDPRVRIAGQSASVERWNVRTGSGGILQWMKQLRLLRRAPASPASPQPLQPQAESTLDDNQVHVLLPDSGCIELAQVFRHLRLGNRREAQRYARAALEINPDLDQAWLVLAGLAEPGESLGYARRALEINPNSQRARQAVSWAESRLAGIPATMVQARAAPETSGGISAGSQLGSLTRMNGDQSHQESGVSKENWLASLRRQSEKAGMAFREIVRYPSAVIGSLMILFMVGISIYTVIKLPYSKVVKLWVSDEYTYNPELALPAWVNLFRTKKLAETIELSNEESGRLKSVEDLGQGMAEIQIPLKFDFEFAEPPQEIILFVHSVFDAKRPFVTLSWHTPDGRAIDLGTLTVTSETRLYISQDDQLKRRLGTPFPQQALFSTPGSEEFVLVKGRYELRVSAVTFEENNDVDAELIIVGSVYGLAGTDHRGRDLSIALLWGAPIALAMGFFGAVCTTLVSITVAAVGVWYGGWVDRLVQGLTEINIILPVIPVAVMAYFLYGKNVWIVIGVVILFSILGTSTKNYRSAFVQIKEAPYIEAARTYGASNWRIIRRYLLPRLFPAMIPQLVAMVPGYVFLEATLAVIRVGDPYIPTWGNIIYHALVNDPFRGNYYRILEPIALLMVTGLAFALQGFALDRIFNPRLRSL